MCLNQDVQDTSGSSDLPLSESFHVACRMEIVYPDNPICFMYLQVLAYSTVVQVLKGFPKFFNCPNEVTSIVRTHLSNVASPPYEPS